MTLASADLAFFLDVRDFAARRHFPIASDDASARESGETEKPNETHDAFSPFRVRRFPSVLQPFVSVPLTVWILDYAKHVPICQGKVLNRSFVFVG
jgi:hypothetical protein